MVEKVRGRARWLAAMGLLTLAMSLTTSAQTSTVYVGPSGSNSSSCGTSTAPCATISYALSSRASVNSTIRVLPGSYTNQGNISISLDGITLTAADPNNRPVLNNSSISITAGANNVTVSYLRIKRASAPFDGYDGIITTRGYPTLIDNNELWSGNQGVLVQTSQQVTVSNNYIHDLGLKNTTQDAHAIEVANHAKAPLASGYSTAIRITGNRIHTVGGDAVQENSLYVGFNFSYLIIDHNIMYDLDEQCGDFKGTRFLRWYNNDCSNTREGGLTANNEGQSMTDWEIFNNIFYDHEDYAIFSHEGFSARWLIYNNVIFNNVKNPTYNYCAVHLPGDSGSYFYNNTLYNNTDTSGSARSCGIATLGSGTNVVNNVFYNNGAGTNDYGNIRKTGEDSGTPSYNYVYPASCGGGSCQTGTNVISTCFATGNCAGFVNIAGRNFHPAAGAPVIDKGRTLAATYAVDYDGKPRSGVWDLGAFEGAGGGSAVTPPAPPTNLRILR